jgi:hypothetical protein
MSDERHNAIVSAVKVIADVGSFMVMIIISMALGIYGLAAWAVSFILSTMVGIGAGQLVSNSIKKNEEKKYGYLSHY